MLQITLPILATEAASALALSPLTWSVPPLTLAVLLVMLRPTWRPVPQVGQLLLLSTGALTIGGLFELVPAYCVTGLALLSLGTLLLDELLVQLPALTALSNTLRRKR